MNNFFNNLVSAVTGQNKVQLSQDALKIQEQIAKDTLTAEIEAQRLRYSPELSIERTKQIALIAIPVLIGIGLIIYIKYFK